MLGFSILMVGMQTMSGAVAPLKIMSILWMYWQCLKSGGRYTGRYFIYGGIAECIRLSRYPSGVVHEWNDHFCSGTSYHHGYRCRRSLSGSALLDRNEQNGKRTALIYLFNDLFGMLFWSIVFYSVNAVVHFPFMNATMSPVLIAMLNTVFRAATILVLLPFIKWIEKLFILL